jgi:hypothetical protein
MVGGFTGIVPQFFLKRARPEEKGGGSEDNPI